MRATVAVLAAQDLAKLLSEDERKEFEAIKAKRDAALAIQAEKWRKIKELQNKQVAAGAVLGADK